MDNESDFLPRCPHCGGVLSSYDVYHGYEYCSVACEWEADEVKMRDYDTESDEMNNAD